MKKERPKKRISRAVITTSIIFILFAALQIGVISILTAKDVSARGVTTFKRAVGSPEDISGAVYREINDTQSLYVISAKLPDPAQGKTYRAQLLYQFPKFIKSLGTLTKDDKGNWVLTTTVNKSLVRYTMLVISEQPGSKPLLAADFKNEQLNYQQAPPSALPDSPTAETPAAASPSQ